MLLHSESKLNSKMSNDLNEDEDEFEKSYNDLRNENSLLKKENFQLEEENESLKKMCTNLESVVCLKIIFFRIFFLLLIRISTQD